MANKRLIAYPLAALVALALSGGVALSSASAQHASLQAQKSQLAEITQQIDDAQATADEARTTEALQRSGASAHRVAEDRRIIEDLAEKALTWSDHTSYEQARATMERVYGIPQTSTFMSTFLPPAPVTRDAEGNEYAYIDAAGLNSRVSGIKISVLSVDALEYTYLALVDVAATSNDGKAQATSTSTLLVTIDGEGRVSDLAGFASTTPPITSP